MISKNCIYDLSVGLCVLIGSNIFLFKSLFWNISLCNNLSTICQRSMGSQMEFVPSRNHVASTCSAFQSLWQHSFQLAEIAAPFSSSRGIATTSSMESAPQGSPAVDSDITPRIKFKRLDKTSKHIMQILDKEAIGEVKAQREIPDIKPGYIVQLKVEVPENKRRISTLKGIVIARRNAGLNTTFRLRRLVAGVGIESLFPLMTDTHQT
ncbi:uncharacterized protein LOC111786317 isoform X2 [Cucurbita pepo subsp. pepo]|uniref:uncharacterized protein LOC111786317 isoform X2 n=1 Tax=Cucurbita pepo subsp. pepo TaxID=3664 RepID=UPI000C9D955E|nr:uncharacterized protein LOC111786317 isoform X2 [Cucurbita pepo subsp. pepo]